MDRILTQPGAGPQQNGFWAVLTELGTGPGYAEEELSTDAELDDDEEEPLDEEEKMLLERRRELKALLIASRQRADALASAIDVQVEEVVNKEKERTQVIEELSRQCSELQRTQEERQQELLQELEKLNAATQQCSECENRSQFLVERIITLLACSPLDPEHIEVLKAKHHAEREMLRQFEDIRQQYDEVRQQNVELASRLLEESSFSRRLSDQLAEAEERFSRFGSAAADWQIQTPRGIAGAPALRGNDANGESRTLRGLGIPPLPLRCEVDEGPLPGRWPESKGAEAEEEAPGSARRGGKPTSPKLGAVLEAGEGNPHSPGSEQSEEQETRETANS